jgi:hypothetical protein
VNKTGSAFLSIFLCMLTLERGVWACSCGSTPSGNVPCARVWNPPALFSGRVTAIEDAVVKDGPDASWPKRIVNFSVIADYRGGTAQTLQVTTARDGAACGYNFNVGRDYLVYAYKDDKGGLSTGLCTPTRPLDEATDDIAFLASTSDLKPVGSLFGGAWQYKPRRTMDDYSPQPPMPGLKLTLEGEHTNYDAVTDAEGKYRFADLAAGQYTLKIHSPEGFTHPTEQKITIREKGCSVYDISLVRETSVSGSVRDTNGEPVTKLLVDLVPVDQVDAPLQHDRLVAELDAQGRFTFSGMTAGSYYLGLGLGRFTVTKHAFPKTFYPGTTSLRMAGVVVINEGDRLKNLDFQLPPKMAERHIDGFVLMPDGTPAKHAYINIREGGINEVEGVSCGPDGKFSITVFEGLQYRIWAHSDLGNGEQRHSAFKDITDSGEIKNIKLIITEPYGSCIPCLRAPPMRTPEN